MKLNADIVYNALSKHYKVEMFGPKTSELSLKRPEFFMEEENIFLSDHLYLATADHLPLRPRIQQNSVLICIGDNYHLNYYRERLCLMIIKNRADFFKVHRTLQNIYDYYEEWEKTLYQDLFNDYDIRRTITDSQHIFNKTIYVMDKSFRFIAATTSTISSDWISSDGASLNSESLSKFMSKSDLLTEKKNALKLDMLDKKVLCVNLFNKADEYEGCLCIPQENDTFVDGEDKLAEYLANFIQLAIEKNPLIINDNQSSMKRIMQNLIDELPLSHSQRIVLTGSNNTDEYVCVFMRNNRKSSSIPLNYICDVFEETFERSIAFVKENTIVAFINVTALNTRSSKDYRIEMNRRLNELLNQMGMVAGISNEFTNLFDIRFHYLQSQSALENGLLLSPSGSYYYFSSYALMEMIVNSLGGLPAEAYYPKGLKEIIEHDRTSGISYMETLKVFLEENMSYTATAKRLFIHRSTLIDRIERIEKEMNMDLKDSDKRLQLEMILKAIDLEELIRQQ